MTASEGESRHAPADPCCRERRRRRGRRSTASSVGPPVLMTMVSAERFDRRREFHVGIRRCRDLRRSRCSRCSRRSRRPLADALDDVVFPLDDGVYVWLDGAVDIDTELFAPAGEVRDLCTPEHRLRRDAAAIETRPPRRPSSTSATSIPLYPHFIATGRPAIPPPRTIRS